MERGAEGSQFFVELRLGRIGERVGNLAAEKGAKFPPQAAHGLAHGGFAGAQAGGGGGVAGFAFAGGREGSASSTCSA